MKKQSFYNGLPECVRYRISGYPEIILALAKPLAPLPVWLGITTALVTQAKTATRRSPQRLCTGSVGPPPPGKITLRVQNRLFT
jgi:hypothetical protein